MKYLPDSPHLAIVQWIIKLIDPINQLTRTTEMHTLQHLLNFHSVSNRSRLEIAKIGVHKVHSSQENSFIYNPSQHLVFVLNSMIRNHLVLIQLSFGPGQVASFRKQEESRYAWPAYVVGDTLLVTLKYVFVFYVKILEIEIG